MSSPPSSSSCTPHCCPRWWSRRRGGARGASGTASPPRCSSCRILRTIILRRVHKAIGGMKYTMSSDADSCFNSTHFALQAELEYLATSRAGRRSGLEGPPARWLGSQSCCTEAAGKKAIEIDEFFVQLSPLPQWMLAGDIWEESESQPCWLWQAFEAKRVKLQQGREVSPRKQLTNTRSNEKQVEAAPAVGGGWWVGSQVVGVVRNQFSWDADYVIRRNNPFMPFDNSRKLLVATNHSIHICISYMKCCVLSMSLYLYLHLSICVVFPVVFAQKEKKRKEMLAR